MPSESLLFSPAVQAILDQYGEAFLPLSATSSATNPDILFLQQTPAAVLFPRARDAQASVSGLLLILNHWEASHSVSQEIESPEGSYWHAIAHRIEPDSFNASYWFRRVGRHPIFPELNRQAASILVEYPNLSCTLKKEWDPFLFIEWCDEARKQPGSPLAKAALTIQKAEWQLLFNWCSQPPA